ncbi:MAG TPA: glycosyltransferase family 4 protein [Candidatus Saccharimonadales bacterium]|nr:glycosyltransferase family 4 protein [Candidatus Saccharimonadales bacterium]
MKIGFVFDDSLDKTDGVQQYVLALGNWLSQNGHEIHYLVGQTKRTDIPHLYSLSKNVKVRFNGNRLSIPLPTSRSAIQKLLKQESYDVLHIQMPYSPLMAHRIIMCAPEKTAIVGTFHVAPASRIMSLGSKLLGWSVRSSLKRFDAILSVSIAAQKFAMQSFGIKSEILPNVIDYQRFSSARPLPQYNDNIRTLLFLGRLVPRKGCLTLLQAIQYLVTQNKTLPEFRVLICGTGPLEDSLKLYVHEHNLESWVAFIGYISEVDKPRFYASSDLSIFPSSGGESFGIVLLEAMACGHAAILAGNNIGYASVLRDKQELLFPPTQYVELANKIEQMLVNDTYRNEYAIWGAQYTSSFDTSIVAKKLLAIYKAALR